MAVIKPYMIKRATSTTDLSLKAEEESYEVLDINCTGIGAAQTVKVLIDDVTMNVIPAHLLFAQPLNSLLKGLWTYTREKFPDFPTYKVQNGGTLKLVASATAGALSVEYTVHEAGDFAADAPGAKKGTVRPFILAATHSDDITATGTYDIDTVIGLPEVPKYPFVERVPSTKQIEIYGIAAYSPASGSTRATYLRIWHEESVLFDEDRNGFMIDPTVANDLSNTINVSAATGPNQYSCAFFRFPTPWILKPMDSFKFEIDASYDGTNTLAAGSVIITLIGTEKPVA